MKRSIEEVHKQLAGGVIMDVINVEQAKIAEAAGSRSGHGFRKSSCRHSSCWWY